MAPSADYIERAYNHAKYNEFSSAPMLEITIPTLADPALAPAGKHVMSVIVQYAPYSVAGGWPAQRQAFTERVIDTIQAHAPGLRDCIQGSELLTPPDIEREFRITGGHWHHAELALDQLLMVRPVPGAAQYQTPVPGLFLCGAGCHPGRRCHGTCRPQRGAAGHPGGCVMLTESEPHYRQPLLKTPFHERSRALSQLDSFVPWAGYTTVDVFTSVEQEYFAIRNASSLYDLTPMVKYRVSGAGRAALPQSPGDA